MNNTIKAYLSSNHPDLNLTSIHGKFNLRFELGGEVLKNGTIERVDQATSRAIEIYKEAIGSDEVIILIKEYDDELFDIEKRNKGYLSELLPLNELTKFEGCSDQVYYEVDASGDLVEKVAEEETYCDLLIGKLEIDEKTIAKIIRGRANLEMGFDPAVPQDIYFYSISNKTGFRIYDDRGCDVWSNDKEKLRPIYETLNNWILDYNRPEIDEYFK